jgi:hypothetical protein
MALSELHWSNLNAQCLAGEITSAEMKQKLDELCEQPIWPTETYNEAQKAVVSLADMQAAYNERLLRDALCAQD